ncbi:hypothetical protein DSECCO2_542990 [anaerobic digester metagenome]
MNRAGTQIVVDGFRKTNYRNAFGFIETFGSTVCVITADGNQHIEFIPFNVFQNLRNAAFRIFLRRERIGAA